MKKLALVGGVLGLGIGALLVTHSTQAADHLDGPTIGMAANRMADINDVYAWMTSDASKINLVMTVSPADNATSTPPTFGPSVLYVFHVTSRPGFGMAGSETKIICKFASATSVQCWVGGDKDYAEGDPSNTAGLTSRGGHFKVFAGTRSDPFFFNLHGFKAASSTVKAAAGGLTFNAAGCPDARAAAATLQMQLQETPTMADPPCPANVKDCFLGFNVKAIVIQIDKSLVLSGTNSLVSVWGSTHMAQ